MKKILLSLLSLLMVFALVGCENENENESTGTKSNYKSYECRYNKDDNAEGKRYLTRYIIELNSKNEAEIFTLITGYSNYGSASEGYNEFCDGLKKSESNPLLEKYKDAVAYKVVCDEKNNYEAYAIKEYQVKKIKDINEFSKIYKDLEIYIKEDGTFDLDAWKNYFNTNSLKAGNYSCDF